MKKGFTLIELLVVIIIVGILLAIGMGLSRSNLEKIKAKAVTEELAGFFDTLFLQVNASNYQNTLPYTGILLNLENGKSEISYEYFFDSGDPETKSESSFGGNFEITALTGDTLALKNANILYTPFSPACKISSDEHPEVSSLLFSVRPQGREEACFSLQSSYCKLKSVACKD